MLNGAPQRNFKIVILLLSRKYDLITFQHYFSDIFAWKFSATMPFTNTGVYLVTEGVGWALNLKKQNKDGPSKFSKSDYAPEII